MAHTFQAAAAALLSEHGHRLPDLSAITLLVPHHHVRAPFIAALKAQLPDTAVFLPPRLVTLPDLAAGQAGRLAGEPDSLRLAGLYGFLSRIDWLDEAALWPQAQAMQDLLLELDDALLAPPEDYAGFAGQVEQAVRRKLALPMAMEARMIFDVWRAYHQSGEGGRKTYARQLASWLATATGPVYSLGLHGLSRLETRFLEQCRESLGLLDLPVSSPRPERRDLLVAAWRQDGDSLPARAARLSAAVAVSPLAGTLSVLAAGDMEMEAQTVAGQIRAWLAEGLREVAVVALDRLAARRLRAVLERDAILMQDETGWTFSTASVSHVLDRWLALLQDDFYHRDLLDLLKSPFVFGDVAFDQRLDAIAGLERVIARRDAVSGLKQFVALARGESVVAGAMLERMERAANRFRGVKRQSLSGWLETLFAVLDDLGARAPIEADHAGRQLLELLHRLGRELVPEGSRFTLAQWRGWLNLQLDRAVFQENGIESPIRLTHLAAARLRDFEAVVILGADAGHLPPPAGKGVFSDALGQQLGLPGQRQRLADMQEALIDVLSRADRVLLSWQAWRGKDPNPPSPWLLMLETLHQLAYGQGLRLPQGQTPPPIPATAMRTPEFPCLSKLPERLSASGWQKLVSCPYRYFAHYDLELGETEEVAEEMEKADYGERVHAILKVFHARHPVLADAARAQLQADLESISLDAFEAGEESHYLALGWRLRWQKHIQSYLDWALAREAEGWRWQEAEREYSRELALQGGQSLTLYGRLDRLDEGEAGRAVVDYKTQSVSRLRGKLKTPGEDVQLAFYGVLTGAASAGLVALDDDRIQEVRLGQPLADAAEAEAGRIRRTMAKMAQGAPLPANGAQETCAWCEMRGLCRKEHDYGVSVPEGG
jgi:ATP-dependent helicase/nuclease subunit B